MISQCSLSSIGHFLKQISYWANRQFLMHDKRSAWELETSYYYCTFFHVLKHHMLLLPWISRVGTPQYSLPDMNHDIYCHRRLSLESNSSTFIYFCLWLKWKNLTNLDCSISISILPTFSLSIFSLLDAIVQFIAIQYEIICNENSVELKMFYIAMSKF